MKKFSIKNLDKRKHFIKYGDWYVLDNGYRVIQYDKNGNMYILGYLTFNQILKLKLKLEKDKYGTKIYSIEEINI